MAAGVTVRDVVSKEFVGVTEGERVDDVIEVLVEESAHGALVLRGEEPVGIVTEGDLLAFVAEEGDIRDVRIDSVMRPPPEPLDANEGLETALTQLSNQGEPQLPVRNGKRDLLGVVSVSDVLATSASLLSAAERSSADEAVGEPEEGFAEPMSGMGEIDTREPRDEEFSNQGVCESCGSLTRDLENFNGQLICPDCRSVT